MAFTRKSFLLGSRPGPQAACAAVIADTVCAHVIDDRLCVRVADDGAVHVHDRGVVVEIAALPISTGEAGADVAESVVDATVKSDIWAPVTGVPEKGAVVPAPVSRCPQEANFRRFSPGSRNPVIVVIIGVPSPIAGRPQIAFAGTDGLGVHRQNRGCDRDGYCDTLREGTAGDGQHRKCEQQAT